MLGNPWASRYNFAPNLGQMFFWISYIQSYNGARFVLLSKTCYFYVPQLNLDYSPHNFAPTQRADPISSRPYLYTISTLSFSPRRDRIGIWRTATTLLDLVFVVEAVWRLHPIRYEVDAIKHTTNRRCCIDLCDGFGKKVTISRCPSSSGTCVQAFF